MRKVLLRSSLLAITLFILVIVLFFTNDAIIIIDVAPRQFSPSEDIIIRGSGFGQQRNGSEVRINDVPLIPVEYISWGDRQIIIRAPRDVRNGTLTVARRDSVSNLMLITNADYITPYVETTASDAVQIINYTPLNPSGGDILHFNGIFTGYSQLRLLFTIRIAESGELIRYELAEEDILQRSLHSFSIRLPSGVRSGNLQIAMDDVVLENYYLEIDSRLGTIAYHMPQRYAINYGAYIANSTEMSYAVWLPLIPRTPAQPEKSLLFISEQFEAAFGDNGYFFIAPEETKTPVSLRIAATVLRTEQRSVINPSALTPSPNIIPYQLERYLINQPWLAVNSDSAQREVASVAAIPNFYLRARAVYQQVLSRLSPQTSRTVSRYLSSSPTPDEDTIGPQHIEQLLERISSTEEVSATAVEYALLTETLLRTAAIPSRIVTGVYFEVDRAGKKRALAHYWNEFFLPRFGWLSVDTAMGDEMYANPFPEEDADIFYFGNLDGQRLELSRAVQTIPQYYSDGAQYSFAQSYLLFTHNIELEKEVDEKTFYLYPIILIEP